MKKGDFFDGTSRCRSAKIRDRYIVLYLPVKRKIAVERAHPAGTLCAFRLPVARQRFAHTHTHVGSRMHVASRARARARNRPTSSSLSRREQSFLKTRPEL